MITIDNCKGYSVSYESWGFSGGEVFFRLKNNPYGNNIVKDGPVKITARLYSSTDVMQLLMATDALRRYGATEIDLVMPYVPYARQDRVCNPGEALSIKVFCDLINSQGYRSVEIWDAHSDVTSALLDRCTNVPQTAFVTGLTFPKMVVVSPDAGAMKKAFEVAKRLNTRLLPAYKHRDVSTGEISHVEVPDKMAHGFDTTFLIVDDICDRGRTFIELAKELRHSFFKGRVELYVTHGIFNKGLDVLKPYIDHVYTANIWPDVYKGNEDYVTVLRKN